MAHSKSVMTSALRERRWASARCYSRWYSGSGTFRTCRMDITHLLHQLYHSWLHNATTRGCCVVLLAARCGRHFPRVIVTGMLLQPGSQYPPSRIDTSPPPVAGYAVRPDGTRIATASAEGTIHTYVLSAEELVALARSRVTRSLTTLECQKYLHREACPEEP